MPLRETFTRSAGAVIVVSRIRFIGFPEEHVGGQEHGGFESLAMLAGIPVKTSGTVDHGAIHQVAGKFDIARSPSQRICLVQRTHVHPPVLHRDKEKTMLRTVVRISDRFAWLEEPSRR